MIDRHVRPYVTQLLRPAAIGPVLTLSPTVITTAGLVIGLGAAVLAWQGWFLLALIAWLLNRVFDALDGVVARAAGATTSAGGFLDMNADVVVYAALPLGVAAGSSAAHAWTAAAFLVAGFYVNITGLMYLSALFEQAGRGAEHHGESTAITMPVGLVEGFETIVGFVIILALPSLATWTMAIGACLVLLSAAFRLVGGVRQLRRLDSRG